MLWSAEDRRDPLLLPTKHSADHAETQNQQRPGRRFRDGNIVSEEGNVREPGISRKKRSKVDQPRRDRIGVVEQRETVALLHRHIVQSRVARARIVSELDIVELTAIIGDGKFSPGDRREKGGKVRKTAVGVELGNHSRIARSLGGPSLRSEAIAEAALAAAVVALVLAYQHEGGVRLCRDGRRAQRQSCNQFHRLIPLPIKGY